MDKLKKKTLNFHKLGKSADDVGHCLLPLQRMEKIIIDILRSSLSNFHFGLWILEFTLG
jgi:hypothetical protein